MTGPELRALRHSLGLSVLEMGRRMGYRGFDRTISRDIRRYEKLDTIPEGAELRAGWVKSLLQRRG